MHRGSPPAAPLHRGAEHHRRPCRLRPLHPLRGCGGARGFSPPPAPRCARTLLRRDQPRCHGGSWRGRGAGRQHWAGSCPSLPVRATTRKGVGEGPVWAVPGHPGAPRVPEGAGKVLQVPPPRPGAPGAVGRRRGCSGLLRLLPKLGHRVCSSPSRASGSGSSRERLGLAPPAPPALPRPALSSRVFLILRVSSCFCF